MRRFVVDHIPLSADKISIGGKSAKRIIRVLRMQPGDELLLIDPHGSCYRGKILSLKSSTVEIEILQPAPGPKEPPVDVILCQAILKAKNMDLVIQKTTELGVCTIIPFHSQRTIVQFDNRREQNKLRHWHEIAKNATEQSGRIKPPEIQPVASFADILAKFSDDKVFKLILWEQERARELRSILRDEHPRKTVAAIVGPEGGFSRAELRQATNAGFVPVSLGCRILRAETAAIVIVALCQYEWGDLGLSPTLQ